MCVVRFSAFFMTLAFFFSFSLFFSIENLFLPSLLRDTNSSGPSRSPLFRRCFATSPSFQFTYFFPLVSISSSPLLLDSSLHLIRYTSQFRVGGLWRILVPVLEFVSLWFLFLFLFCFCSVRLFSLLFFDHRIFRSVLVVRQKYEQGVNFFFSRHRR